MTRRYGHLIEHWQAARSEMRQILIASAREKRTITYGELSLRIQTIHLHPYSYAMAGMLDEISLDNRAKGQTPLATLVVRQSDGRPGPGFFRKSFPDGAAPEDVETYWQAQFEKVCAEWGE